MTSRKFDKNKEEEPQKFRKNKMGLQENPT
jgi:hypothetical protein